MPNISKHLTASLWITLTITLLLATDGYSNSLETVKFSDLPLELAIIKTIGTGENEIAYFADPNCKYCKILEEDTLPSLKNVKIHLFIYPILGSSSEKLANAIWCSDNPLKAWNEYLSKRKPPKVRSNCNSSVAQITEFGKKHGIYGTPTIMLKTGKNFIGNISLSQLEAELYIKSAAVADTDYEEEKTGFLYDHPGFCGGNNMIND